jgi:tetratricopeptide (TPR) repeat protein
MLNIGRIWYADTLFNEGYKASRSGEYALSYQQIGKALVLNPNEPLYYDEYALPAAAIALAFAETNDSTSSSTLALQAVSASNFAINKSPNNINFLKSRARVFIALSSVDESYLGLARQALELAEKLAPTDPKITYNLGLLYEKTDSEEKSIEYFSKAVEMKKDYRDAYYALAVFYLRKNEIQKAKENLEFILEKLNPEDEDAIELLDKIK